jgi:hypothetical protein
MRAEAVARSAPPTEASANASVVADVAPSIQAIWAQQKLIRAAEFTIQVENVARTIRVADSIARRYDALMADVSVSQADDARGSATINIRVPVARFDGLLNALRPLGDVQHEQISTEDITKAYTDLETRLAVKEQTVTRLRSLLSDRTGRLSDVLEVERELGRAVAELEQMKGERRYYGQLVAVSTVSVQFVEPSAVMRPGFVPNLNTAFRNSINVLGTSVAWLVYLITFLTPWILLTTAIWWLGKRWGARIPNWALPRSGGGAANVGG